MIGCHLNVGRDIQGYLPGVRYLDPKNIPPQLLNTSTRSIWEGYQNHLSVHPGKKKKHDKTPKQLDVNRDFPGGL